MAIRNRQLSANLTPLIFLFNIPIQPNIHDKLVIFNEDSGINVRKSAQPALRVPKNPVRKLKKE